MRSRSRSRERKYSRHRSRSRSPQGSRKKERNSRSDVKKEPRHHHDDHEGGRCHRTKVKSEPPEDDRRHKNFGGKVENEEEQKEPEKPSFELSGALMQDTNVFNGVVIKYSEPEEARKPKRRWRFYVFKGEESLPVMHLHRQSAFLIGKDRKVADLPVDHPSCSRQHAVLQYRFVNNRVRPYIIDLGSSNGTYLNNQRIDPQKYVELMEKDMLKFGYSSREYVLLHENSQEEDD
eukprot:00951.XXX_983_156_1 [CDS] Oithona nana genome sequencing.